jgi:type II secretory ATPase GspE/PulE/Tfp pilus assembly ATPase PilB-like protein
MGVEPFLAASSIIGVVAQRLVRRNCPHCSSPYTVPERAIRSLGISPTDVGGHKMMRGAGCDKCLGTGFKGRLGIFEFLFIDDHIQKMITDRASAGTIKTYATDTLKMRTLIADGRRAVLEGATTPEEVLRVCQWEEV